MCHCVWKSLGTGLVIGITTTRDQIQILVQLWVEHCSNNITGKGGHEAKFWFAKSKEKFETPVTLCLLKYQDHARRANLQTLAWVRVKLTFQM